MKDNIIEDLSTLTTIPVKTLERLTERLSWCLCNALQEALLKKELTVEANVGFGTISFGLEDDVLRYKFIPSPVLEESLRKLLLEGENPLVMTVEKTLATRVVKTYKDFI